MEKAEHNRMDAFGRRRRDRRGPCVDMPLVEYFGFDSRRDDSLKLGQHAHTGHEITYVFAGTVVWELGDGTRLRLNGGDMALTQPGVPHRGYLNLIQPASIFWLSTAPFTGIRGDCCGFGLQDLRRLERVLNRAGNRTWFAGEEMERPLILLRGQLDQWLNHERNRAHSLLLPGIRGLIGHILTVAVSVIGHEGAPRTYSDYVRAVRKFMEEHLGEEISVDRLAGRTGLSASRLHAIFKKETGLTPNDYLQRLRIDRAQELLRHPDARITDIALDLGFSTSQYFATCFRKYTGMTPGRFRRSIGR